MKATPLATWPDIPERVGFPLRGTRPMKQKTRPTISSSGRHAPTGRLADRELAGILLADDGIHAKVQHRSVRKPRVSKGQTELKRREHRAAVHLGIPFERLEEDLPSPGGRRRHRRSVLF